MEKMLYLVSLPRGLVPAAYAVLCSDVDIVPNCEHGLVSGMVGFDCEFDCLWNGLKRQSPCGENRRGGSRLDMSLHF